MYEGEAISIRTTNEVFVRSINAYVRVEPFTSILLFRHLCPKWEIKNTVTEIELELDSDATVS